MIRYAIISDIHGNMTALEAVMNDIKQQNIDRVICIGDIIGKGPNGHDCVRAVKSICDAVVRGNNDVRYTKSLDEIAGEPDFDYDYFLWTQKQLKNEDIAYLRALPMCCEFVLSGRLVRCFHAGPHDVDFNVFNFSSYHDKLELFKKTEYTTDATADVVVCGHTHFAGYEKLFGYTLINAGSVGNTLNVISDNELNNIKIADYTMAEYVILTGEDDRNIGEISVEFRNVPYDKQKEIDSYNYFNDKNNVYINEIIFGEYRFPDRIDNALERNGVNKW